MRVLLVLCVYLATRVLGLQLSILELIVFVLAGLWNGFLDNDAADKAPTAKKMDEFVMDAIERRYPGASHR